jgi:hypothetical protein
MVHYNQISAINGYFQGPKGLETTFGSDGLYTAFYVDGNAGNNLNDGKSWATAVKTVAAGIALADDDIAVHDHWDRRNKLYINGGTYTEDLVRFPEKTDVIGVGCSDWRAMARIAGNHVPAAAVSGCRFINICFFTGDADIAVDVIAGCHGIAFINCSFETDADGTYGIRITSCADYLVEGCRFFRVGGGRGWTAGIQLAGSGAHYNGMIRGNYFYTGIGVDIDAGADGTFIVENYGDVTTMFVDDEVDEAVVMNNYWVSATTVAASYDLEVTRVAGNIATGSDDSHTVPAVDET